tara:strand:+ start:75 stop:458 length:384 start_codon:yes stop_codon:yes gene_type:complete
MAVENCLLARTFTVSGNNLSADADQFIFCSAGATEGEVDAAVVSDTMIIGVSQDTAKTGEGVSVGMVGISKVRLGGTVQHGNLLRSDATGRGVLWLGKGAHSAMALEDGASGEVIEALILIGRPSSS